MPHEHPHLGHGSCSHESGDSDYLKEIGIQYSLYTKIDFEHLECLNETIEGSAKDVFKPYELRLDFDKVSHTRYSCKAFNFNLNFSLWKVMPMKSFYLTYHSPATLNLKVLQSLVTTMIPIRIR